MALLTFKEGGRFNICDNCFAPWALQQSRIVKGNWCLHIFFSTCCYHTLSPFPWNFFCAVCMSVALLSCNYFLVWECGVRMHEITFWNKKQQNCIIRRRTRWSDTFWYQIAEEVWIRVIVIGRHIYLKKTPLWQDLDLGSHVEATFW